MKIRVELKDPFLRTDQDIFNDLKDAYHDYGVPINNYLVLIDPDEETGKCPVFIDGKLNKEALEVTEYVLGLNADTFLEPENHYVLKWYDKYSYFMHLTEFKGMQRKANFRDKDSFFAANIMDMFFGDKTAKENGTRYDYQAVHRRMLDQLKEMDKYLPGTIHEGAEISEVAFRTEHLVHYPKIKAFVDSFFELIDNFSSLFFKGLKRELNEEEIKEYNLLVSVLGIKDKYYQVFSIPELHYREFLICKETYQDVGSDNIFDYVTINPNRIPAFWKCAELTEYREIYQRLVDINPEIKIKLKKLAILICNFCCDYIWSDTDLKGLSPDRIYMSADPLDETNMFCSRVYVRKTAEELSDDDQYADMLMSLSRPEKMGGLAIKAVHDSEQRSKRKRSLLAAETAFLEALHG